MAEKVNSRAFPVSKISKLVIVFLLYVLFAKIGLAIHPVSGFATVVWPPTGIALASLLIFGIELWPAIVLGAFFVNLNTGAPVPAAAGIGFGNALEAIVGVYLLERFSFSRSLIKIRDVLLLLGVAAIGSTSISATIGVASLFLGGLVGSEVLVKTWVAWWIGDMLGALIVTPLVLVWFNKGLSFTINEKRATEFFLWLTFFVITETIVFDQFIWAVPKNFPISFLAFPALIWGALRFGQRTIITALFAVDFFAIWGTLMGFGPFFRGDIQASLLLLQIFVIVASATILILNTSILEKNVYKEKVDELNATLKVKIKEVERLNRIMVNQIQEVRTEKVKTIREVVSKR
jgi:integral membrane sensor domain MASE1